MRWQLDFSTRRGDFELKVAVDHEAPILGLFGPSGSGKTSLLESIAGLIPVEGTIELAQRRLDGLPAHRRRLGVVHQDGRLFPHLSVAANLDYGHTGQGPMLDEVVDLLELEALLERRPTNLSGGEARRVALGRALLSDPTCLLLDEPFAGVDVERRRRLIPFLRRVHRHFGLPMLVISHELEELLELGEHLALLADGELVGVGRYTDLIHDHEVLGRLLPGGLPNVWPVEVVAADEGGASRLRPEGGGPELWGPPLDRDLKRATAVLRAADVALSLQRIDGISVRNQWCGPIRQVETCAGRCIAEIDLGRPLLVELTEGSWRRLGLEVGREVWALVKANSVRLHG